MRIVYCAILLGLAVSAQAQTYRWVDPATGKTVFSDNPPPPNARKVTKAGAAGAADDGLPFATRQAMEKFPVTLYTAVDCVEQCRQARDLLNKRGVPFSEKMVQTQAEIDDMKAQFGAAVAPLLKVGRQNVQGFSATGYDNMLDLAGYPKSAPYGSKPSGGLQP